MAEIVYVLTNPAMPGLVKIGRTSQEEASTRIGQLYNNPGVPVPFKIEYVCKLVDNNSIEVEKALHTAFEPQRINPRREFFQISPEQAIAILRLLHTEEVTTEQTGVDKQSLDAGEQLEKKRPPLNFEEMAIPIGAILSSTKTDATATVVAAKKVRLGDGEPISLTAATRQVLQVDYDVQPTPHWKYQGKLLRDIYDETYSTVE